MSPPSRITRRVRIKEALLTAKTLARFDGVPPEVIGNSKTLSWANVERVKKAHRDYLSWGGVASDTGRFVAQQWSQQVLNEFYSQATLKLKENIDATVLENLNRSEPQTDKGQDPNRP